MSHHHHHKHKHERHHGRHHQNEEEIRRPKIVYYGEPVNQRAYMYALEYKRAMQEQKNHKQMEHVGEIGAVTVGAFAVYEMHEAKKDPEHAHKHTVEAEIVATAPVGATGYAFYEHQQGKESHGQKNHHHHH